jgi:quercetin dioxygenase-like cupin family protein
MKSFCILLFGFASLTQAATGPHATSLSDQNLKWGPCPEIFPKGCEMSVLHDDPSKKGADIFLRVPSNYVIPPHSHTSAEHINLLSGNLELKYKGQESMNLKQGSYTYGPAGHAHEAKCTSQEACVLSIGFEAPVDAKAYTGKL